MFWIKVIIFWCFLVDFSTTQGNESTNDGDTALKKLKEVFTNAAMDLVLKFSFIINKFDVPYLGSANSMYYAKEIAKAIAYAPLFNGKEGVEEYILDGIAKIILPSSPTACGADIWCSITSVTDITADVSIQGKFVTPDLTEQVVRRKVNSLAGNVIWRLSRISHPDPDVLLEQANLSPKISNRIYNFIRLLSTEIYNSSYVSDFYKEPGLDGSVSLVLSSPICGSSFLDFKIGLIPEMSSRMSNIYMKTKPTYALLVNSTIDSMVMSSIVSETIALKLLKLGFFESNDNLEEATHDIMKLIMVGITSNRMKIHASNAGRNTMKI